MHEHHVTLKKSESQHQVVYGEVYVPNVPDSQGDWATAEDIEQMAWDFLKHSRVSKIDTNHDLKLNGCVVVESFIARKGDPDFIEGSWVLGVHVPDPVTWEKVLKNELNGFSLWGMAVTVDDATEWEVPDTLWGKTTHDEDHDHQFQVKYDEEGNFLGGMCEAAGDPPHVHMIMKGTITEDAGATPHRHRFSFIDGLQSED